MVRVKVPFSYRASKNAIWSMGARSGHVFARRAAKEYRSALAMEIRMASRSVEWHEAKVWIDILVEKPDMRGDAVNVIDLVCDAVKDAIGVDDRWFSIRRVDWAVVKDGPCLYVGVSQVATEAQRACSVCGSIKPLTSFAERKHVRRGRSRECADCLRPIERARSVERRRVAPRAEREAAPRGEVTP